MSAVPSVPAYTDSHPNLPIWNIGAHGFDRADNFVSRYTRVLNRIEACNREKVAVADAASLHFEQHLSRTRLGDVAAHQFEGGVRLCDLHGFHLCHWIAPVGAFCSDVWGGAIGAMYTTTLSQVQRPA